MQISVTCLSMRIGRSARSVRSSADDSITTGGRLAGSAPEWLVLSGDSAKLIHTPEIQIAREHDGDAISLRFDDGWRNADGRLQHLRHDLARRRRIHDDRIVALALRLRCGLNSAI